MAEQPTSERSDLPYSVRIERTAKGARYTVHCYNKSLEGAIDEAVKAYDDIEKKLVAAGFAVAPIEAKGAAQA